MYYTSSFKEFNDYNDEKQPNNIQMIESLYYQFDLNLHRLYLDIDSPCSVQIWWKRSKHKAMSKHFRVSQKVQYIDLNDILKTSVKCKFQNGKATPFYTSIMVLLYPTSSNGNSCKSGGSIQQFDITQILLPDNKKASVSKRFQLKLQKSPPNSRILFTLSSKFLKEGGSQESLADISFQANTPSIFNRSQTDMTFRPPATTQEQRNRRTSRNRQGMPMVRQNQLEKIIESPLQRNQYFEIENHRQIQKRQVGKVEQPLGFSFGPVGSNPERQKQTRQLLEQVNQLRRELNDQKKQNERLLSQLRARESQRNNVMDDKKLQLLNQLNSSVNQCDQLKRQRQEIGLQYNKLKEQFSKLRQDIKEKQNMYGKSKQENRELAFNFNKLRDQLSDLGQKYENKKRECDQLRPKYDKIQRQNQDIKNEIFRKQSQLISNQNQLQQVKMQYINKSIPIIQELKRVNQDIGRQRSDLERALNEKTAMLDNQQKVKEELSRKLQASKQQWQRQKNKLIQYIRQKQVEFQTHIGQIQQEMSHFIKQKQLVIGSYQVRNNQLVKKNQQLISRLEQQATKVSNLSLEEAESYKIQISQLKVKIKHHQEIYEKLEQDYGQKEKDVISKAQFIQKVREYVTKIEQESKLKDQAIKQRDEFIIKAKEFITKKEGEMFTQLQKAKREVLMYKQRVQSLQKLKNDVNTLSFENREKQKFLGEIIRESNQKQQRIQQLESEIQQMNMILNEMQRKIEDMQNYIDMQHERFETNMDQIQQLNRKIKSQQETLEDLVKKNLDLQIQVNLKTFELKSLRGH